MVIRTNKVFAITIIILIFILIVFSMFMLYNNFKVDRLKAEIINNDNAENKEIKDIKSTTEHFIKYLFTNDKNKAGELSLGVVRYNILSNNIEIESNFNIKRLNTEVVFSSNELAIAKSTIEYIESINNEYDAIFYEIRLLKENDEWKVYYLNEEEPSINYNNSNNYLGTSEEFKKVFDEYADTLSRGEYEKAAQFLVGRAKKMHKKANPALNELNLISKIRNIENSIIYSNGNVAISKFNYINNDRPLSVLVYFYLTEQGWKIYNVNQI